MTVMKSVMWVVAAAFTLAATGCGPRSAKEFSGTYAGTGTGTVQTETTNPDSSKTTKTDTSGPSATELTFNAPDPSTLTINGDSIFGNVTFKQNASNDSVFDAQPQTSTATNNGVTTTTKLDQGSVSFSGLDATFTFNMTSTTPYTDADGLTTTYKMVLSGTFTGTKK